MRYENSNILHYDTSKKTVSMYKGDVRNNKLFPRY